MSRRHLAELAVAVATAASANQPAAAQSVPAEVAVDQAVIYELPNADDYPNRTRPVLNDDPVPRGTKLDVRCLLTGEPVLSALPILDTTWVQLNSSPVGARAAAPDQRAVVPAAHVYLPSPVPACPENKFLGFTAAEWWECRQGNPCTSADAARWFADGGRDIIAPPPTDPDTGEPMRSDNLNDAAHHCLWLAHMTAYAGVDVATRISEAHETVAGSTASHAMDRHNNTVTMKLVTERTPVKDALAALKTDSTLREAVDQALLWFCAEEVEASALVWLEGSTLKAKDGGPIDGRLVRLVD